MESSNEIIDSDGLWNFWTNFKIQSLNVSERCLRCSTTTSKSFLTLKAIEKSRRARLECKTVLEAEASSYATGEKGHEGKFVVMPT